MDAFLKDGHPLLGSVPGPLALAGHDGVIWAAGGGRGESALLRFDDEGWRAEQLDAGGLRAVLPLDAETVVVAGEPGRTSPRSTTSASTTATSTSPTAPR